MQEHLYKCAYDVATEPQTNIHVHVLWIVRITIEKYKLQSELWQNLNDP